MTTCTRRLGLAIAGLAIAVVACGDTDPTQAPAAVRLDEGASASTSTAPSPSSIVDEARPGVRLVSAEAGAAIQADPPPGLVILDVRAPEEFAAGHLDGAEMLDFYRDDFAEQLALLDPDVPYLVYCRSGNRSGQTASLMAQLGFTDVADVDGGILAWTERDLPTVTE